ncbi:hypothetical protein [Bacillus sp. OTU530]|uniref:hypothetical protein n=1 Tax=Bacillus sp. OTU530 TaxID=3043862 RepID=UPI00313D094B
MTIKMKMAQDELILSGVQVPTIPPVPVLTSLVQETIPTTARRKKCKNKSKGELIEENQIFS